MNLKIKFEFETDVGKSRKNNEDNALVDNELSLALIADGMGGHNSGEVASNIAVTVTRDKFAEMLATQIKPPEYDENFSLEANQLAFAAKLANSIIHEAATSDKKNKGMGTTLSAVYFGKKNKLSIAHIGDSRVYLARGSVLKQLTTDHSLVMEHVRKGVMTKEQADRSPLQNILTKALGTQKNPSIDIYELLLEANDRIILCTDGLFKAISEEDMMRVIMENLDDKTSCQKLVETANINGGPDNITVILGSVTKKSLKETFKSMFNLEK